MHSKKILLVVFVLLFFYLGTFALAGTWKYYPQIDRSIFNGYNLRLNYAESIAYCQNAGGWLASEAELNSVCGAFDLRRDGDATNGPYVGGVRVTDPFVWNETTLGHRVWHDLGWHFTSPACGQIIYDYCGTTAINEDCINVVAYLQDFRTDYGLACILIPSCPNGIVERVEQCDDGNEVVEFCPYGHNCQVCGAACTRVPGQTRMCGDGVVNAGYEHCDDGNEITETCDYGETSCIVCNSICELVPGATSFCGNGALNPPEECDSGANNSDTEPNACRTNCHSAACGDFVVDSGETCDGSQQACTTETGYEGTQNCRLDCSGFDACTSPQMCGDGIVNGLEECDFAAPNSAECTNECMFENFFGDVLEVKIISVKDSDGKENAVFSADTTMKYIVSLKNKSLQPVMLTPQSPLAIVIFSKNELPGEVFEKRVPLIGGEIIAPQSTSNFEESFSWSTTSPTGTYIIQAIAPLQDGEKNFYLNNSDSRFITVRNLPKASVPETNIFILPILIVIVVTILTRKGKA